MAVDEVVVGATKKDLVVTITDDAGTPINITGGSAKLQGQSEDLPSVDIDFAGTLTDPAVGKVTFPSIGTLVTTTQMNNAGKTQAVFNLRVRYQDASAKFDYSAEFQIMWVMPPI